MKRNDAIAFFLHFEPQPPTVTHQEKKFGGVTKKGTPIFYPTPALANARAALTAKIMAFAPEKPWTCPVSLSCRWTFRAPAGRKSGYMMRKPDTDNLQKMLKDVMTDCGFWKDDAQVVVENVEKIQLPAERRHGITILVRDVSDTFRDNGF